MAEKQVGAGSPQENFPIPHGVYEWNHIPESYYPITIVDESPRDGVQGVSGLLVAADQKLEMVRHAEQIGIPNVTVGIYGSESQNIVTYEVVRRMRDMNVSPIVLARASEVDVKFIEGLLQLNPKLIPLIFFGSSGIRTEVQGWDFGQMMLNLAKYSEHLTNIGATVMVATEDTTRTTPERLDSLAKAAIDGGARRVCIADTVGHCAPDGAARVVSYIRRFLDNNGGEGINIDWHGHNDIGMGVANAVSAIRAGATAVHGVINGIGERAGNMSLEQFLLNTVHQRLSHPDAYNLKHIKAYADYYSSVTGIPVHKYAPILGDNAFNTEAGIHADAQLKARREGNLEASNLVYYPFSPEIIDRSMEVSIGTQSGLSNVYLYCTLNNIPDPSADTARAVLDYAQKLIIDESRLISKDEVLKIINGSEG